MAVQRKSSKFRSPEVEKMSQLDILEKQERDLNALLSVPTNIEENIESINPEQWNNIPVCLVKAMRAMIDQFVLHDQRIKDVNSFHTVKHLKLDWSLKNMEQMIYQKDDVLKQQIEQNTRQIYDKVVKGSIEQETYLGKSNNNMDELRQLIANQTIFVSQQQEKLIRLQHTIDSLSNEIVSTKKDNDNQLKKFNDQCQESLVDIKQALIVPGMIGQGETFSNIRGFLSYIYTYQMKSITETEQKLKQLIQSQYFTTIDDAQERIGKAKKEMQSLIDTQFKNVASQIEESDVSYKTLISENEQKVQNHIQTLFEKIAKVEREKKQVEQQVQENLSPQFKNIKTELASIKTLKDEVDIAFLNIKIAQTSSLQSITDLKKEIFELRRELKTKVDAARPQSKDSHSSALNVKVKGSKSKQRMDEVLTEEQKLEVIKLIRDHIPLIRDQLHSSQTSLNNNDNASGIENQDPKNVSRLRQMSINRKRTINDQNNLTIDFHHKEKSSDTLENNQGPEATPLSNSKRLAQKKLTLKANIDLQAKAKNSFLEAMMERNNDQSNVGYSKTSQSQTAQHLRQQDPQEPNQDHLQTEPDISNNAKSSLDRSRFSISHNSSTPNNEVYSGKFGKRSQSTVRERIKNAMNGTSQGSKRNNTLYEMESKNTFKAPPIMNNQHQITVATFQQVDNLRQTANQSYNSRNAVTHQAQRPRNNNSVVVRYEITTPLEVKFQEF